MKIQILKNGQNLNEYDLGKELQRYLGNEANFFIGRASDCFIQLDDHLISREHALIKCINHTWKIEKKSEFGDFKINAVDLKEAVLNDGDVVVIGPYILNVSIAGKKNGLPEKQDDVNKTSLVNKIDESDNYTETLMLKESDNNKNDLDCELNGDLEINDQIEEIDRSSDFDDGPPLIDEGVDLLDDGQELMEEEDLHDEVFNDESDNMANESGNDGDVSVEDFENPEDVFNTEESSKEDYNYDEYEADSNSDYAVDNYEDDSGTKVVTGFAEYHLEIFGEYAPYDHYKLQTGPNYIGRDAEKCQIVLQDPEVSGVHACVRKKRGELSLEDLKSSNGTILNGKRINKSDLQNNDEFVIGSTTFTLKVGSNILEQQNQVLMPVEIDQVVEVEEVVEIDGQGDEYEDNSEIGDKRLFSLNSLKDPKKRVKILIYLIILVGVWMMLDDSEESPADKKKTAAKKEVVETEKKSNKRPELSEDVLQDLAQRYKLAITYFEESKYNLTIAELEKIIEKDPEYQNAQGLLIEAKGYLRKLLETKQQEKAEEERLIRLEKVKVLLKNARDAVDEKNLEKAEANFARIYELDPENLDVTPLKLELDAWHKKIEKEKLETQRKLDERKRQEDLFRPYKNIYLQSRWFDAIGGFEKFLYEKGIDEDLIKEATALLEESKNNLEKIVSPLIGKARSLKEGQDLKAAYSTYKEVLIYNPLQPEALNEMDEIKSILKNRSRRVYRDAIVSESLSLFDDAKEKFQEVQQISPIDSEYYIKATEKLEEYLE